MTKYDKILKELNLLGDANENNIVKNLRKKPPKEPKDVMPHTYAPTKFSVEQADLLYLPEDDGYK